MPSNIGSQKMSKSELKKIEEKHSYKTHHIRNFDVQNQPISEIAEMQMFASSDQTPESKD